MNTKKIITICLYLLCLTIIILSVKFIITQKWSNIDEYAHMDYIEKLSDGKMPLMSDKICNEIYLNTLIHHEKSVVGIQLNREGLGLANYSYQAQHPPLYYSLLTIPNLIMKALKVPIFSRLIVLRLISYFLFVIGMFMCLPMFNLLNKLGFNVPKNYALGCVFFGLLIATHERYGLGNNQLSPLLINSALMMTFQYYHMPKNKYLYTFIILICLSLFSSMANVFCIPILFLIMLNKYIKNLTLKNFTIATLIMLVSAGLFVSWKLIFVPEQEMANFIRAFFEANIPANILNFELFVTIFLNDMFIQSFINPKINLAYAFYVLFSANIIFCILYFKTLLKSQKWLLVVLLSLVYFICTLWFLNTNIKGYTWVAFRHYQGLIPFFYVSCTGFILLLHSKYKTKYN